MTIAVLGVATTVLLAVLVWWNATLDNDRKSSTPDECDRFFSLSPDILCVVGFDGNFQHLNPAAEKILGYSPASMLGKPFIQFVHPDDRAATLKEAESMAAGNPIICFENRWRCRNGDYKWLMWKASPFDEEKSIYAVARDITDRKSTEESLQHSNSILRSVIESTPDVIFVKDIQGRYAIANSATADWLQISIEEIIGKDDSELFPPEIAQRIMDSDRRIVTAGEHLNYEEIVPKNGEQRTLLTTKCPWKDSQGNIIGVIGISRDISDRKIIESALIESNILFESILESTTDCIFVKDAHSRYLLINSSAAAVMGKPKLEIIGKNDTEFFPPEIANPLMEHDRDIIASGIQETIEETVKHSAGNILTFLSTKSPLRDREKNIIGVVGVVRDITAIKQAETALRHSEQRLQLALWGSDSGIWDWNIVTDEMYCSPEYSALLGYEPGELEQSVVSLGKRVHPDDVPALEAKLNAYLANPDSSYIIEHRMLAKSGEFKWILARGKVVERDANHAPLRMIGTISDISDRKQAEITLQQNEAKYRCLTEATSQIIWDTNANGEVVNEQPGWSAFTGKIYDEIKGWGWLNDIHPEDTESTARLWSEAVINRTIYKIEHRLLRHDGQYRYMSVRAVPILNPDGSIREWVGVHADITPTRRAEAELRQQKEFLGSIYDSVDYSIFVLDVGADGEFRYAGWNRAAELLSGVSSELGCCKTPEEILSESTAAFLRNKLRECLLENSSISYEQAVSFDTIEVWSITTLTPLRDEFGKIYRIVGSAVDITQRKQAEQALAEQLKLSVFTADVGISLTQNHTLPTTLQNCTHAIVRHLDAAFARIWTLNETENVLELQASAGMYTHINGAHSRVAIGEFKIGLIAKERQPHLTNAVTEDPRVSDQEWAKREGMVGFAGYPLIVDNQLVGVVAMFSRHELNESTLIALASVADVIALGIKRKQTEVDLATQQQTLRSIIDNAPIWVWMTHRSGRMLLVNKTFCQDVAISEETFIAASHYSEVLGVEGSANCMASDAQAWSQDTPYHDEELLQLADGEYHYLETIKTQVKDDSGNAIGLIGLGLDVTEQKESQRRLQESEARFRNLAEQEALLNHLANNIRASLDLDTILATTVRQIREFLQLDRCLFMWYQPDASPPIWSVIYEANNPDFPSVLGLYPVEPTASIGERIANLEIIRIDDIEVLTTPAEREFLMSVGINSLLDIPLQTQSGQIGVILCGACGTPRQWSDDEVALLVAVGNQLTIAINQAELYTQSLDSARIAREQAAQLETALSELQQAQTQLVQSEKMSSLGQMVAGIAHEINNPVSFIFGNLTYTEEYTTTIMKLLQMYRDEFPEPPTVIRDAIDVLELDFLLDDLPKMLSSMQVGATRIRDIVRSLRNFSRLDESDMKKVNIHEGIDSTLMILEHRLKAQPDRPAIQLVKEYGELPLVECYAGLLNQVFMNIIANAIDAVEEQNKNSGMIKICTEVEGSFAAIAISDNGTGMTDVVKQRIFDPFYTTKAIGSGTGMGLAISHSIIVEKHQGEIKCISAVGKGTKFVIKIPIVSH